MVYPCIPQFYYMKVGHEGVYITPKCFPDEELIAVEPTASHAFENSPLVDIFHDTY